MVSFDKCEKCESEQPPLNLFRFDKDIYKTMIEEPYYREVVYTETIKVDGKNKRIDKTKIVKVTSVGYDVANRWHTKTLCQGCKNMIVEEIRKDYSERTGIKFV